MLFGFIYITQHNRNLCLYTGVTEDGDIYNPENLKAFRKFVYDSTNNRGVHFVMADGVSNDHQLII